MLRVLGGFVWILREFALFLVTGARDLCALVLGVAGVIVGVIVISAGLFAVVFPPMWLLFHP